MRFFCCFSIALLSVTLALTNCSKSDSSASASSPPPAVDHCDGLEEGDPDFEQQWYIHEGLNGDICSVWKEYTGRDIVIAISDAAIELTHPELSENVMPGMSYDFKNGDFIGDGDNPPFFQSHGNHVAGLIAARGDNNRGIKGGSKGDQRGIKGVAYEAKFFSYNIIFHTGASDTDDLKEARYEAVAKAHLGATTVSSNSWDEGSGHSFYPSWRTAVEEGLNSTPASGTGEGVSYLFAAGNDGTGRWNTQDRFNNFYGVLSICAVNREGTITDYSTRGGSLWICGTGGGTPGDIYTLDFVGSAGASPDEYHPNFNGTSASTPIVAGIVALIRQANPALSWRDVKVILADTARMPDGVSAIEGANMYSKAGKKYAYSYNYGFGIVDAKEAVEAAKNWQLLPAFLKETSASKSLSSDFSSSLSDTLTISADPIQFIEHVALRISVNPPLPVKIYLTSPLGQRIKVLSNEVTLQLESPSSEAYLGLTPFLGQAPNGEWKIEISASNPAIGESYSGNWYLEFVGH